MNIPKIILFNIKNNFISILFKNNLIIIGEIPKITANMNEYNNSFIYN